MVLPKSLSVVRSLFIGWAIVGLGVPDSGAAPVLVSVNSTGDSLALGNGSQLGGPVPNNEEIISLKLLSPRDDMNRLRGLDVDILGLDLSARIVDVRVKSDLETKNVLDLGLPVHSRSFLSALPAPDDGYHTYDEVVMRMQTLAATFPDLTMLKEFGRSVQGRKILGIKISDNVKQREKEEPTILFNAMHHAREVMTTEVALDIIETLLFDYGVDAKTTEWVDNTEIWIIPMVNPDGNHRVWNGYNMWRKNVRDGHGVDLNRNYPFLWNHCNGSSGATRSDTYRGPDPASEPETRSIMAAVSQIEPVFDVSYHSYSELVIYPFGCTDMHTPNRTVVEKVGQDLASKLPKDHGSGNYDPGTAWELLYDADGGDIDWMYDEFHVIPFVIEVNSRQEGFQPSYSWKEKTVQKQRAGWKFLLERLSQSGVRGSVTDAEGLSVPGVNIVIESLGGAVLARQQYKVKSDGTYHIVLNPGMYRITFSDAESQEITIGATRLDMDVTLF